MKQRVLIVDGAEGAPMSSLLRGQRRVFTLQSLPLLALSLALYTLCNLATLATSRVWYKAELTSIELISGDSWHVSGGDAFLGFSMALLFIELLRATKPGGESIVNHALSAVVFIAALVLFLTQQGFGNSTFFSFMVITLLDFMAGFIITATSARRDTMLGAM